ncbi:uncharacterized protein LOC132793473 isoform X3 [Drosophila nasuta]|uniref:uncharacterized protein LOC132793473 isoform X3 n=1 Tax=Drosophila nasuta TaxID=42062 RepID=UPI00295F36C0|nr:uncharacterized protein LOC132793473 isoform X3 [Drosophila nasuta]
MWRIYTSSKRAYAGNGKHCEKNISLEPSMRRDEAPTRIINKALDSDASSDIDNDMSYVEKDELLADTTEVHNSAREEDLIATRTEWLSGNIRTQSLPKSCNRNLEEETINLIRLQQDFFRSKNQRAQEKHDLEMRREKWKLEQEVQEGKLRIEMIELEIMEKRAKLDMK